MLAKFVTSCGCIAYRDIPSKSGDILYIPICRDTIRWETPYSKPEIETLVREFKYQCVVLDELHGKTMPLYREFVK